MNSFIFFRNDDVGTLDSSIIHLTELFQKLEVPISYAAVPITVQEKFAIYFLSLDQKLFDIHQHGLAHTNHKENGKFYGEFGSNRTKKEKEKDLVEGLNLLEKHFGINFIKIFTPPWNNMDSQTHNLLVKHDYIGYSIKKNPTGGIINNIHDIIKNPYILKCGKPKNLSVSIDIIKDWKNKKHKSFEELVSEFEAVRKKENVVGIMLHEKVMNDDAFLALEKFINYIRKNKITIIINMGEALISNGRKQTKY